METDGGGTSAGKEKLREMLATDLDSMSAFLQKRNDGPATPHQSGALGYGDRVALTVCSSIPSSPDAMRLFSLLYGHDQGLKIIDLVCVFVCCVLPGGDGKNVPVLPRDGDEIWDDLVTNSSRVTCVAKETDGLSMAARNQNAESRIREIMQLRVARERLLRRGCRAPSRQKLQSRLPCHGKHKLDKVRDTIRGQGPSSPLKRRRGDEDKEMSTGRFLSLIGGILDLSICKPQEQCDLSSNTHKKREADEQCDMDQGSTLPRKGVEIELLSHRQHESGPSIMNQHSCVGNLVTQDTSSGNSGKILDVYQFCNDSCDMNQLCTSDVRHGDLADVEELERILGRTDCRYKDLLQPCSTWEVKVVKILNMVRCREFTVRNPKKLCGPTRFCEYNMAFFDLDKESEIKHEMLFCKVHPSRYYTLLDDSVNVISIKVAKSDVPINIYGTVLARDQNDYRCVYLFNRGRDNPQLITKRKRMLALTGPYRALGGADSMYFEFHLKIKGKGALDQDFCKGLIVRNGYRDTAGQPCTFSLESCLGPVEMVCMPAPFALEASLQINVLNRTTNFTGKISAWTSGNDRNKIILYDNKVAGTKTELGTGGSVSLSRSIVAVPVYEDLVVNFSVCENHKPDHLKLVIGNDVEDRISKLGSYHLQVKVVWNCVTRQRLPKMWKHIGDDLVLW